MPCCPCIIIIIIIGGATRARLIDTGSYTTHLSASFSASPNETFKYSRCVYVECSSIRERRRRGSWSARRWAFRARGDISCRHFKFKPTFQIDARVCVYDGREGDAWRVCDAYVRELRHGVRLTRHVAWFGRF